MREDNRNRDGRTLIREALRRAPGPDEPDMARLIEAVPDLIATARHGATGPTPENLVTVLAGRARRAIPTLATATAIVVALAFATFFFDVEKPSSGTTSFDAMILSGTDGGGSSSSDVLLEAVMNEEKSDG